ncbi:hypothetical protein NPIL_473321 [Nephila pilipes]|uniref:Uncharacterized protein n=1 Tax=Nephila pilipes TaxID=299642 RepID=A0A8X6N1V1_NEPPI|nr:hypothetical protein NPIL_473321 [Nephila pilipes]
MAVLVALNRKRSNLKGQVTKLMSAITDKETMDIPQLEALEKRYKNKRMLVDCHPKGILNLPTLKHELAKDLRYFLDCSNKNRRSLNILDFEEG